MFTKSIKLFVLILLIIPTIIFAQNKSSTFNLLTDSSFQKFVGKTVHFNNIKYVPKDLVVIKGKYITSTKTSKIRKIANENFILLAGDFYKKFKKSIVVVSGYRDYNYQLNIKKGGCPDSLCAKAGYSEHQTGLALDLFEATTNDQFLKNKKYKEYFEWLKINAYKFGFTNSYQKGSKIDGYDKEPWHWRFVGIDLATKLIKNKSSLTEFYYKSN